MFLPIMQDVSQAESTCVNEMVEAIAMSGSPVRSQQIGEPELTLKERREELLRQYRSRPLVFLERYHVCGHKSVCVYLYVCGWKGPLYWLLTVDALKHTITVQLINEKYTFG